MDWVIAPAVPVTVIVTCDPAAGADWALEELPHPTASSENTETKRSKTNIFIDWLALRVSGFCLRVANTVPNNPKAGNRPIRAAA